MTKRMSKCKKTEIQKFLWWRNKYVTYNHDWVYSDTKHRMCRKCKTKQIYFGLISHDTYSQEDWRESQ